MAGQPSRNSTEHQEAVNAHSSLVSSGQSHPRLDDREITDVFNYHTYVVTVHFERTFDYGSFITIQIQDLLRQSTFASKTYLLA